MIQKRGRHSAAYHIDRILDWEGYVPGNLQLITCHDNVMKEHEMRRVIKAVGYDWRLDRGFITDFRHIDSSTKDCPF